MVDIPIMSILRWIHLYNNSSNSIATLRNDLRKQITTFHRISWDKLTVNNSIQVNTHRNTNQCNSLISLEVVAHILRLISHLEDHKCWSPLIRSIIMPATPFRITTIARWIIIKSIRDSIRSMHCLRKITLLLRKIEYQSHPTGANCLFSYLYSFSIITSSSSNNHSISNNPLLC